MKIQNFILTLSTTTLLCACGGGGGDGDNTADPKPQTPPDTNTPNAALYQKRFDEVKNKTIPFRGDMSVDTLVDGQKLISLTNNELKVNIRNLPQGWYDATGQSVFTDGSGIRDTAQIRSYNGFYSGAYIQKTDKGLSLRLAYGVEPLIGEMPNSGKATYNGVAFNNDAKGTLAYQVDFGQKEGQGKIAGLGRYGDITLRPARLTLDNSDDVVVAELNGTATGNTGGAMRYNARLWGPGAAEISGRIQDADNDGVAVFQGSRGAITP